MNSLEQLFFEPKVNKNDYGSYKQCNKRLSAFYMFFQNASDLILLVNSKGKILEVNRSALEAYGYSYKELLNMNIRDLEVEDHTDLINIQMQTDSGKGILFETIHQRKNGENLPVEVSSHQLTIRSKKVFLILIRDITARKQVLENYSKIERIKTIGKLSTILAHEIKNSITGIYGFLQLLVSETIHSIKFLQNSNLMFEELEHANSVLDSLIVVADDKIMDIQLHNLNEIIYSILPSIQATARSQEKKIEILLENTPKIRLDQKEIKIMLFQLISNALDAMPFGGKVSIRTNVFDHSIVLSVEDNGSGIDREFMDKLGTPFLTTKDNGNGLGLVICNCIAMRHNAKMRIESSNSGTKVQITFKLCQNIEDDLSDKC